MHRCSHVFPDGRPCRALAPRPASVCRNHTPQAVADRDDRARRAAELKYGGEAPLTPAQLKTFWQNYHGIIRNADESDFDDILANLMAALEQGAVSDRSAGRLLRALVRRRRELAQQRMNEKLIRLAEQSESLRRQGFSGRGLYQELIPQVRELMGPSPKRSTC